MPDFQYTARSISGELVNGLLQADTRGAVVDELARLGYFPIEIKTGQSAAARGPGGGVRDRDVLGFTRQLTRLIEAGVPLARALNLLARHSPSPAMRDTAAALHADVRAGSPFSDALAARPGIFPELFAGMVRSGEASGNLVSVLRRIADHYERRGRIATHIWNALTYPIFVSIVGLITVIFLLAVVIPRFESVFSDIGQALPLPTRALMATGSFFSGYWWLPPAVIVFIIMSLKSITAAPAGRAAWHRLLLRLPAAGSLARRTALARFTRVTGTLMLSGVTILKAIELAAANCGNLEVARRLAPVLDATREGKPLASAFQNTSLFDPFTVDITAVSEETGSLPTALTEIADRYDDDVIAAVQRLTSILEPAVIVALGVVVAFIVAAMLLPILQLNLTSF